MDGSFNYNARIVLLGLFEGGLKFILFSQSVEFYTIKLRNQWTILLYHVYRQETYLFSGKMTPRALKKVFHYNEANGHLERVQKRHKNVSK